MDGKAATVKSVAVCPSSCPFAQTKMALGAVCGGENRAYFNQAGRAAGVQTLAPDGERYLGKAGRVCKIRVPPVDSAADERVQGGVHGNLRDHRSSHRAQPRR